MSERKRILFIDFAKALAIMLVVIGHYIPDEHPNWYGHLHSIIYGFHMPLFMFASGFVYVATVRQESYGSFLLRKFKRLMIPYFVVSLLLISIKLATQGTAYVEHTVTWMSYVRMFYLPEAGPFLWFVWGVWWMFVVIPFFDTKQKRLILLALAIVIRYLPIPFPEMFCLDDFKKMFVYFCLGCVTYDHKDSLKVVGQIPCYVYLVLFVGMIILKEYGLLPNLLQTSISPLISIAFFLSFCKWLEQKNWRPLNSLLSVVVSSLFIIYLFHTTFEGFAKAIIHKIPILMDAQNDLMFTLGAVIVVSCGIIVPILLDRLVLKKYRITIMLFGYK